MGKLVYIPLEVIPSRYTEMVLETMREVSDIILMPDVSVDAPKPGQFLNFAGSCLFKANQLTQICQLFLDSKVNDGDAFLFADLWFPGLEMVRYLADANRIRVKIGAINHAGRADSTDFINSFGPWADYVEHSLHRCCDYVFVGSEFHRSQVLNYLGDNPYWTSRIIVTGQPMSLAYVLTKVAAGCKELGETHPPASGPIVWPHRVAEEKGARALMQLADAGPDVEYAILSGVSLSDNSTAQRLAAFKNIKILDCLNKEQYYWHLFRAKAWLSTAAQETFGYSLHEALVLNVPVIAPHQACYPEVGEATQFFTCYTSLGECLDKCRTAERVKTPQATDDYLKRVPFSAHLEQREILCG